MKHVVSSEKLIICLRFHVHSKLLADHLCHGLLYLRLCHVHCSRQELCKVLGFINTRNAMQFKKLMTM